jgi:LysM repeat protein
MINVLIFAGALFFQPHAQDSLGIETVNGKVFVVHQVGEKETLYGISRRYGATVSEVIQYNPAAGSGLSIGQILKVPYAKKTSTGTTSTTASKTTPAAAAAGGGIIHVVATKETMYSISRAYNVTEYEIKQWNNLTDNAISVGQELVIKKRNTVNQATTTTATTPVSTGATNAPAAGTHVVEAKETLYSIANKYNITTVQLKEWNNLAGNEISIGQALVVRQPGNTVNMPKKDTATTTQQTVITKSPPVTTSQSAGNVPVNTQPASTTPAKTNPPATTKTQQPSTIVISESTKNGDEILQSGIAELIEGTDGNRKYLALHRTAPVGTILKVKNELNNREVFVRVMGKLQDTAGTDKVIIRVSKSAYDRLGAIDQRFRVEVTYYK